MKKNKVIIVGGNSDIGYYLREKYRSQGWEVISTVRKRSENIFHDQEVIVDLSLQQSVEECLPNLMEMADGWDLIIVAAGTMNPIGKLEQLSLSDMIQSVLVNTICPVYLISRLYDLRRRGSNPTVIFFSGSGTNSAPEYYSSYCASKIMLIKYAELLAEENNDANYVVLGPGIVKTKIHKQTIQARHNAGDNYNRVCSFLNDPKFKFVEYDEIYQCINWCILAGKEATGGRNISLVHDQWSDGGLGLIEFLKLNENTYKLRRNNNDYK